MEVWLISLPVLFRIQILSVMAVGSLHTNIDHEERASGLDRKITPGRLPPDKFPLG